MKHEKEWYTCDRCGSVIERMPEKRTFSHRKLFSTKEIKMICEKKEKYITNEIEILPDTLAVYIIEERRNETKTIHLCPKCRKDFERFMRSKNE